MINEPVLLVTDGFQQVVEQVFRWRAEGRTPHWIAVRLNQQAVKTQNGGPWRASTVQGMLGNRFYTGRVEFEGEFIRAQHDAIISDGLLGVSQKRP